MKRLSAFLAVAAAVLAVAAAVLVVGCGRGTSGPSRSAASTALGDRARVQFARCMRAHGSQMADRSTVPAIQG